MNPLNVIKYVPLSAMRAVALFVAWIAVLIPDLKIKRTIHINLRLALPEIPEAEFDCFTKAVIRNQALIAAESIKCWAMPPEWSIAQIDNVYNKEVFDEALASPNGMLAIVPHLGTWEMMNAWINQFGSPTILYKPTQNKTVDDFILEGRQRLNATLVPTDASGVKAVFKTLKSGGFSILLPDHVPHPSGGINAPFFGIDTLTSTLAPKLASKTKCSLIGLVCLRSDNKHPLKSGFDIYCIRLDDPNLFDKDIAIATTALNKAIEGMIKRFPKHYMWGYRRFKNLPFIKNPYKADEAKLAQFIDSYVANNISDNASTLSEK